MTTVGSLFSGVGGLDLGLSRAGWSHDWLCESDPWRRTILAQHFPGVTIHADVRNFGHDAGRGAPPDLIAGGFPCQDVSVAGRRAGLAGERSGLWHEFHRIVAALRPRAVLVENVPGLLSSNGGVDMGVILDALANLGYGVAWRVLDAQHFGVPQRRRRVFLLALPDGRAGAHRAAEILGLPGISSGDSPQGSEAWADHTGGPSRRADGRRVAHTLTRRQGGADDNDARARHLVAQPLAHTLTKTRASASGHAPDEANYISSGIGVRRLMPVECERLMGWPDGWTAPGSDARRYAACGDGVAAPVAEWIGRRLNHAIKLREVTR
jgi:DNA (cytosine-5)-methyltransferase 1